MNLVRVMEERDLAAIPRLCRQLGYPVAPSQRRTWFARLAMRDDHCLIVAAEGNGEVVGFLHAHEVLSLTGRPRAAVRSDRQAARKRQDPTEARNGSGPGAGGPACG